MSLAENQARQNEINARQPSNPQAIVLREFGTMPAAQKWASKTQTKLDSVFNRGNESKLTLACNQVDEGCVQVELVGDLGKRLYIADLYR